MNIHSRLLNLSEIARLMNLTPANFHDKLNGRGRAKRFTAEEIERIEQIINADLFKPSEK